MIIYKITNKNNGKCYVGQTIGSLDKRWSEHCSPRSGCLAISGAIKKHGEDSFSREIIATYDSQHDLDNAEIYFIEWYNSMSPNGYNLKAGGLGGEFSEETKSKISIANTGKIHSEESRKNMSDAHKGSKASPETKQKMSIVKKGKKKSEETKKRMSASKRGIIPTQQHRDKISRTLTGRTQSSETIAKRVEKTKGKKRSEKFKRAISDAQSVPVVCLNTGEIFPSQTVAAQKLGVFQGNIGSVLNGRRKHTGGYKFAYIRKDKI